MKLTTEEFEKIRKELLKLMKRKELEKIYSHIWSLERENEDLRKSRDMWKERAEREIAQNKYYTQDLNSFNSKN